MTHPLLSQGKRHPAEGLLSPRDEASPVQRSQNRRGADRVTPGPEYPSHADQYSGGEQSGQGRGRGKAARGGRAARADDADMDSRADQGRATSQSSRVLDLAKSPSSKVAWRLFTAGRQVQMLLPYMLVLWEMLLEAPCCILSSNHFSCLLA